MCPMQQKNNAKPTAQQLPQKQEATETTSGSPMPQPPSPTAAYVMFKHREELRRRNGQTARASITKIHLTTELIARTKQNIRQCSFEDLAILARETVFRKSLQRRLHYRRMEMGLKRQLKSTNSK
ncbi:uncharacterized protein LOC117579066 [Drosophila guanche]|uniref:uncharacterized protein LOC117579066 n=1 Tax=Drosophila guanche TaxID=7266 RepID=UPI0014712DE2|nr:uncharacterized protein LOC117579066 [Drosophila guanche]